MPQLPAVLRTVVCAFALCSAIPTALRAQGSLTPPGAPSASMKSLDQVEPRTAIPASGPFPYTISTPGSYFLTANVNVTNGNGIVITTNGVTLDLNGYAISSTAAARNSAGVYLNGDGLSDIRVLNGNIRGTTTYSGATYAGGGFSNGITWNTALAGPRNVRIEGVAVSGVGNGIALGATDPSNVVRGSVVSITPGLGISAGTISDSAAVTTGSTSIQGVSVANSAGTTTGGGQTVISAKPTLESVAATTDSIATATNNLAAALAQDEPRTPIPAAGPFPYTISARGSYYLTGNVTVAGGDAIVIASNDVTLDLNGFTITSTAATASGNAINLGGARSNLAILNGNIRSGVTYSGGVFSAGPGFDSGINWPSGAPSNVRVSGVNISGVKSYGIDLGTDTTSVVQGCTVRVAGQIAIRAGIVSDSSATLAGSGAITAARVSNCVGSLAAGGSGITASSASLDAVSSAVQSTQGTVEATQTALATTQATVNQILAASDSRTPISSLPYSITQPGSYYLTANLTGAGTTNSITISTSNVTIDLNGYTLTTNGTTFSSIATNTSNLKHITVRNGGIRGGGFGVRLFDVTPSLVENVRVSGVNDTGISLKEDGSTLVTGCVVETAGNFGIAANRVVNSVALGCAGLVGISGSAVAGCVAQSVSTSTLSSAIQADVVNDSIADATSGFGIQAKVVTSCRATSVTSTGIVGSEAVVNSSGACTQTGAAGNGISSSMGVVTNSIGTAPTGGAGVGLIAFTANGSRGVKAGVVSQTITNKYNMP